MRLRVLIPLVAAGFVACRDAHGPDDWWHVTTKPSSSAFSRGTPLPITIVARNVSSEVRQLHSVCARHFRLADSTGTEVPLESLICFAMLVPPQDVAPGDSVVYDSFWNGKIAHGDSSGFAPPGRYQVIGLVFAPEEVRGGAASVFLMQL